jgi:hypothetical protein
MDRLKKPYRLQAFAHIWQSGPNHIAKNTQEHV